MNTQTLDLNRMGLAPMNEFEMIEVDGGHWIKWVVKAIEWLGIADAAHEIGQGFHEGYQHARKHP